MKTLVTGAAGGIGSAVLEELLAAGHRCIAWDIRIPQQRHEENVAWQEVDLSDSADLARAVAELVEREGPIDNIVHCAGIVHYSGLSETPAADWKRVVEVNLISTIEMCQLMLPNVAARGSVVLFGSGTVFKGPAEMFAYVASKAGLGGFVRSLAREAGRREITVNMVSPGFTDTAMVDSFRATEEANIASRAIKRRAVPADIVGPILFLLSSGSRFVTGQNICVDGGSAMP